MLIVTGMKLFIKILKIIPKYKRSEYMHKSKFFEAYASAYSNL